MPAKLSTNGRIRSYSLILASLENGHLFNNQNVSGLFFFFAVIEGEGNLMCTGHLCAPDNVIKHLKYLLSFSPLHNSVQSVALSLPCRQGSVGSGVSGTGSEVAYLVGLVPRVRCASVSLSVEWGNGGTCGD